MLGSSSRKFYTDGQMKTQLTKLDPDKQQEFLRCCDPLFERESEIYLDALAESRASLAQALAQIQSELDTEDDGDDEDDDEDEAVDELGQPKGLKPALFDTTTEMGKHMAAISQAFSDLLNDAELGDAQVRRKAEKAEAKAMKKYIKTMQDGHQTDGEDQKEEKRKPERSGKRKKKRTRSTIEDTADEELITSLKTNLATELSAAAKEEQDAIMEKMKTHGRKIDRERKRQKELLNERIREARDKRSTESDVAYAGAVGNLMERRDELDDIHQQDRSRQQKALKDRLKSRKHLDAEDPISKTEEDKNAGETKKTKKSKRSAKAGDLGNAEEQIEENPRTSIEVSSETLVNEVDDESGKKKKQKRSKKNKADPAEPEEHNGSDQPH